MKPLEIILIDYWIMLGILLWIKILIKIKLLISSHIQKRNNLNPCSSEVYQTLTK